MWEGRVRTEWIMHDIGGVKTKEEQKGDWMESSEKTKKKGSKKDIMK